DYLPEREAYFEKMGATRITHSLLMSRSVWHKVRESKLSLEGLQLSDVLQSLQPARKPIPSRISWLGPMNHHLRPGRKHSTKNNHQSQIADTLSGQSNALSEQSELDNKKSTRETPPSDNQQSNPQSQG
ncbi:MAG: hypothetical protein SWJ54_18760, partial [Cyanobacteriota bacterium]|nr:hypothetical protein [Cyanobacteriota bacterium]